MRRDGDTLVLVSEAGVHRLTPKTDRIVRVTYSKDAGTRAAVKPGVVHAGTWSPWTYDDADGVVRLTAGHTVVDVDKATGSFTYLDVDGAVLLREREHDAKTLEAFESFRVLADTAQVDEIVTPDGVKRVIRDVTKVPDKTLYRARLHLRWADDEVLYGLGQHEEGVLNLRGTRVFLHQANLKSPVPVLVSHLGYGLLVDTYSPMIFSDTEYGSYLHCEADDELDLYFINGGGLDGVVAGYRQLTGDAVMLPRWAYGYLQSQERYETQDEILAVAEGFRSRGFGLDCLVLDWITWSEGLWGQKTMDPDRFPDPAAMVEALHDEHVRLMISVWPNMDEKSANYRQFKDADLLVPGSTIYDAFQSQARELYWQQVREQLFPAGIDAWWCDNSEPITPEWSRLVKPEPDAAHYEFCQEAAKHFDTAAMNAYCLYHAQTLYEGQRGEGSGKRVVNLTRSGYTGQQRYGTILWSGDISATWDTLRKQIVSGLHFCASGLPYWTTDIGAFFVRKGLEWFWDGDYEDGNQDPAYRELYVRWFQYGAFSPVFRSHGTDTRREPWLFGAEGEPFYDALLAANRLRYTLMPYLYTHAYRVWSQGATLMRLLAFDFADDETARTIGDQFLFGDSLMVCPVTSPMYFGVGGVTLDAPRSREVYLPAHPGGWYDLHTGEHVDGGTTITAKADLGTIPVYVKAGTILPTFAPAPSTDELDTQNVYVRVYRGSDATFELYDDAGDGYQYEDGELAITTLTWDDAAGTLTVADPQGPFAGQLAGRKFHVEVIG
ncbi:TIM-barrel domain-containing protein [Xylanimonas sp. McL0601]|uniref:glycoside hydrolase family 31 protein n=1 Tax=Xylanimonas sp. McL0601 TaxID=3414739 RepID=UPI003CF1013E